MLRDGLAVVTLREPVSFGHPHNEPGVGRPRARGRRVGTHLESIGDIANTFNDATVTARLAAAGSADEVRTIMGVSAVKIVTICGAGSGPAGSSR